MTSLLLQASGASVSCPPPRRSSSAICGWILASPKPVSRALPPLPAPCSPMRPGEPWGGAGPPPRAGPTTPSQGRRQPACAAPWSGALGVAEGPLAGAQGHSWLLVRVSQPPWSWSGWPVRLDCCCIPPGVLPRQKCCGGSQGGGAGAVCVRMRCGEVSGSAAEGEAAGTSRNLGRAAPSGSP